MAFVKDKRPCGGLMKIAEMACGTWFYSNCGLWLKAAHDVCVDAETGRRISFNEEHKGCPVEVEIHVIRDMRPDEVAG